MLHIQKIFCLLEKYLSRENNKYRIHNIAKFLEHKTQNKEHDMDLVLQTIIKDMHNKKNDILNRAITNNNGALFLRHLIPVLMMYKDSNIHRMQLPKLTSEKILELIDHVTFHTQS